LKIHAATGCRRDRAAIVPFRKEPYTWEKIEPGLEDAFIGLMQTARDNFE
jgi:hypothetical protein